MKFYLFISCICLLKNNFFQIQRENLIRGNYLIMGLFSVEALQKCS